MNRAQLVNKLSQRMNVSKKLGELYFTSFLDSITENIHTDGRVAIRGFGSFKVNEYKARITKKPITGEIIKLPIRRKISFHTGQELRKTINSEKPADNNTKIFINHIRTSENILRVSPWKYYDKRQSLLNECIKGGKVIFISNRLYGSGPYQHYLKGLNFKMNSKGLAPHPNLTNWLEKGIDLAIRNNFITKDKTDVLQ